MPDVTTIKVPRPLRERIKVAADAEGVTAATLVGRLLDRYEQQRRLQAVATAYRTATDQEYRDLTAEWDAASSDGLDEPA